MPANSTNPSWIEPPPPKQGGLGCFGKGCLVLVLVAALVLLACGVGGYFFFSRGLIASRPAPLPVEELSPEALNAVQERVDQFQASAATAPPPPTPTESVAPGETPPPPSPPPPQRQLVLSAAEINGLIAANPKSRGHAFVALSGHSANVQMSIPSTKVSGFPPGYLNGNFIITTNGPTPVSALQVSKIQANGWPVPSSVLSLNYRGRPIMSYALDAIAPYHVNTAEIRDGNVYLQ